MGKEQGLDSSALFRVTSRFACAGFVVEAGYVTHAAPILYRKIVGLKLAEAYVTLRASGWRLEKVS